ncbi:unnamed protein product [Cunninghamella blakesleeana]
MKNSMMSILSSIENYLVANNNEKEYQNDYNNNHNDNYSDTTYPSYNVDKGPKRYTSILNEKRNIQQGINLLQLIMGETDEQTCVTLYELAMEKLNSIRLPTTTDYASTSNHSHPFHHEEEEEEEPTIWTQCFIILTEFINLFIIAFQQIPIPDIFIRILLSMYDQIVLIEKKYHPLQYICTKIIFMLYAIINKCQQYDLPKFISYFIYILVVFSINVIKILIESIHLGNHYHQRTIK